MNVFRQELRQGRRGLLGWCIGVCVFLMIYMPFMSAFVEEGDALREFTSGLGEDVLKAMGLNPDLLFGALGFYGFLFTFLTLIAAIQAVSSGMAVISKERNMRMADFLLTKPRSRSSIFFSKLLAALTRLAVTQLVFYTVSSVSMLVLSGIEISIKPFVLISLTFSLVQLIFFAIGIFIGAVAPKIKSVITVSMGVSMGFFLLGMISGITGSEALRHISPLKYFDNNYIMLNNAYEPRYLIMSLLIPPALTLCAYLAYTRRDVKAV